MERGEPRDAANPPAVEAARPNAARPSSDAAASDEPEPIAVPIQGTEHVRGRAAVKVKAPIERVREAVLDFTHYAEFMPHYKSCRVLSRTPAGGREVYMEIEALYGAVKMWAQIEVPRPTLADGVEIYETQFQKGNVKDFKAIWRLKKLDDATTELALEVFLEPAIPMPAELMNSENLSGSVKGVTAMRDRAEQAAR